jgi:hypothetical protein
MLTCTVLLLVDTGHWPEKKDFQRVHKDALLRAGSTVPNSVFAHYCYYQLSLQDVRETRSYHKVSQGKPMSFCTITIHVKISYKFLLMRSDVTLHAQWLSFKQKLKQQNINQLTKQIKCH